MRGLAILTVVLFATAAGAQEPALPKTCVCSPPQTALAKAVKIGDGLEIKLKLVKTEVKNVTKQIQVEKVKVVDGKQVKYTETQEVTVCVAKPVGWREVTLNHEKAPVFVHDMHGKSVAWDHVAKALAKETPVLISVEPVDPFYLQTMKPETLVIVGLPEAIYGPPLPSPIITTPPGGNPAAPIVPAPATKPPAPKP